MRTKKRYHFCIKDKHDTNGILMLKEGKVYESFNNILYDDYHDRNICRVIPEKEWIDFYALKAKEEGINIPTECWNLFTNVKELKEKFNLITYTIEDYNAIYSDISIK